MVQAAAVPVVVGGRPGGDSIAAAALPWLRIAILGAPAILVSLAGNGWLRGRAGHRASAALRGSPASAFSAVLCPLLVYGWLGLPRWGLAGSAVANLAGQWVAALLFLPGAAESSGCRCGSTLRCCSHNW